ncbi:MAG TPA: hypothetical protein PLW93_00020 [Candidatus Absconditabacterales bacterium]|nr:hypothetical protein [Candidatus Absconditabacterales bacterium]HNG96638.1 hypothetical protein [Candidatus Absconditabacterales bacterium]
MNKITGHTAKNYLPKINPHQLCEAMNLCTVRMRDDQPRCGVKKIDGTQYEIPLLDVANADTYENLPIRRTYASGCVFLDADRTHVWLLTTKRKDNIQHQFTGGAPKEPELQDVYRNDEGTIKLTIDTIYDNAILRTYKKTGAEVTDTYNDSPLVDRALIENQDDETGEHFWRLVLLMHFVVKSYTGELGRKPEEYVVGGQRYEIATLSQQSHLAPNAVVITNKALEL